MISRMRKTYDAAYKAKVAFEAAKGEKTIAQIASEFSVSSRFEQGSGRWWTLRSQFHSSAPGAT